ncbi:nucleoside phosphorylase [Nocardioides sp. TF02-7]|uniref:nucleoside phosphorylase n=1 Tax=Nocardioides sp. TF02-7 TaxID=2917724 RepID=UPI001F06FE5A|nr:nucleoside phosphorylase [Nocardioides sp. TF02-7]UMG91392.1 nucleoside phosphorylase [Nocardioides sp. TF02-7]
MELEPGGAGGFGIPLTEHDGARRALIEPSEHIAGRDVPEACVITFFGDVVDRLVTQRGARVLAENRWEDGPHPLLEVEHDGQRLAVLRSGVGAPLAGGLLEEVIATGCRYFVVCGGAGSLHADLTLGHVVVVSSALRDEGTSFHYLPPGRRVEADPAARRTLEAVLTSRQLPFVSGLTWTTDAPYRETPGKVAARRAEGCLTVEMEAAALVAIARFRGSRSPRSSTAGTTCPASRGTTAPGRAARTSGRACSTSPPPPRSPSPPSGPDALSRVDGPAAPVRRGASGRGRPGPRSRIIVDAVENPPTALPPAPRRVLMVSDCRGTVRSN